MGGNEREPQGTVPDYAGALARPLLLAVGECPVGAPCRTTPGRRAGRRAGQRRGAVPDNAEDSGLVA